MPQETATQTQVEIINTDQPNPIIKTVEWFDDRFYKVKLSNGETEYYPSVTTVLEVVNKPFLAHWRGEIGNELADQKMNEAARKGTAIHHACTILAQGGRVDWINSEFPEDIEHEKTLARMKYFYGDSFFVFRRTQEDWLHVVRFFRWWTALNPKLVYADHKLYSMKKKVAGTLDFAVEVKEGDYQISGKEPVYLQGGIYTVDLKTGKEIHESHFLQVGQYGDMVDVPIVGGMILHTNAQIRSGIEGVKTYVRTREQIVSDIKDFDAAHALWLRENAAYKPKVMELPTSLSLVPVQIAKEN
jgi:hypothetical protein